MKPLKYSVFCTIKKKIIYRTNQAPLTFELKTWVDIGNGVKELQQTRIAYIDTRYDARLRLWKYSYTSRGLEVPRYSPYKGTEIGKTIPILNF